MKKLSSNGQESRHGPHAIHFEILHTLHTQHPVAPKTQAAFTHIQTCP